MFPIYLISMKFYTTSVQEHPEPTSLVFLLHGWGANGLDLLSIAEMWQKHFPETLFICPEAPEICDANPTGFQWFALGDWSPEVFRAGAASAREGINSFIHFKMEEFGVPAEKVILMGFSQGMMMALSTGLRQKQPFAGILGYSGALIDEEEDLPKKYPKPDICLIHGEADTVVPIERHDQAVEWLKEHEYHVESLKIPNLAHGIDENGLIRGLNFMKGTFRK